MFAEVLNTMRQCMRTGRAELVRHAYDEMNDDDLFAFDLEQCVLTGSIAERQWDETFNEWKYVIHGESSDGEAMAVIAKLTPQQQAIFVTTYRL